MRGCNASEKREEIGRLFERRRMDVMAMSETKLKGKGEVAFGSVIGRKSGVNERCRAKEGVAIIVRDEWSDCIKEWKEISARMMWVRMRFGAERWVFVSAYGPGSERKGEEVEEFWADLNECVQGFDVNENVVVLGDLNARVGCIAIPGIIGEFGVNGVNDSGERMVEMCSECGMSVGNTYFKKRRVHKYTWERQIRGEVVESAVMDYVLIQNKSRSRLLDVNVLRGVTGGMSDHYLVEGRMKVVFDWRKRKRVESGREMIKFDEFAKEEKVRIEYQERVEEGWNRVRESEWRKSGKVLRR